MILIYCTPVKRKNKTPVVLPALLERFAGGGQTMGTLPEGKRVFVWGGLPGESVKVAVTKQKSGFAEGVVVDVEKASNQRVEPRDADSYLSTSPWQIVEWQAEQAAKRQLIDEAFRLHKVELPLPTTVYSDDNIYGYRNKVEFSWWWDTANSSLDLAFFKRGSHGKVPVAGTSLARDEINKLALQIRDCLRSKPIEARQLKTLLIRCDQNGACVWQLYIKDHLPDIVTEADMATFGASGGEVIYSDPRSPASKITERLVAYGDTVLHDTVAGTKFGYAAEGFFQVNLPVYEQALADIRRWIPAGPVLDMYSGVGSIGLTVGLGGGTSDSSLTLVEVDAHAYRELERNIAGLPAERRTKTQAVLAPAERALSYIQPGMTVIVDPPRAGLHELVVQALLAALPPRIIYLSCNPVTQARDIGRLIADGRYAISDNRGYNFFPRTPHIEHLVVLEAK